MPIVRGEKKRRNGKACNEPQKLNAKLLGFITKFVCHFLWNFCYLVQF